MYKSINTLTTLHKIINIVSIVNFVLYVDIWWNYKHINGMVVFLIRNLVNCCEKINNSPHLTVLANNWITVNWEYIAGIVLHNLPEIEGQLFKWSLASV